MFEIVKKDSKTVKGIFEAIDAIVSECEIRFTEDAISIEAIDDGRICLISLKLDKNDFDEYKCDKAHKLGLNLDDMVKILKRSGTSDEITFKYTDGANKIRISMKNPNSKKTRTFSLQLIDIPEAEIRTEALEQIQYPATVTIPVSYLDEAIKDADIFSETLTITISAEKGIIFRSEGPIGSNETILEKEDEHVYGFTVEETGSGTFALNYLKNIVKLGSIADKVELSIKQDLPLKATFRLFGSSSFKYYLAPRVEEEEEDYDAEY